MDQLFNIDITAEYLKKIAEIDEFKGQWEALKNLSPDRLNSLKKVATIESIGSSTRIEGAHLSDQEVEALLNNLSQHTFHSRDEEEVAGYAQTMDCIFESSNEIPLTENHIKQLHAMLLKPSSKDKRHRGEYKKFSNHVEAFDHNGKSLGIVFKTTTPFDTPKAMEQLIQKTQEMITENKLHPLLIIGIFILHFLAIHPFQDGNGRLSRILTSLLLLKFNYEYILYSSLENIIEDNKDQYYLSLRRTQTSLEKGKVDWESWINFFLNALIKQKENLSKKISIEKTLKDTLPELSNTILQIIKERGRITISEIEKITGAPKGTIKARLRDLVKDKKLILHGKGRASWYTLA